MKEAKERPSFAPTANSKANYNDNSKQFAGVRKDLNQLISLVRKISEHLVQKNGGCL